MIPAGEDKGCGKMLEVWHTVHFQTSLLPGSPSACWRWVWGGGVGGWGETAK